MSERSLAAYAAYFESLTPESLDRIPALFAENARFKDPFNDVRGRSAIRELFVRMFASCEEPRFVVRDQCLSQDAGYLLWEMQFRPRAGGKRAATWRIEGMSRIRFTPDGQVLEHIDYWDSGSQFYARLPILGTIVRWIARRV